jgi:hypothetical protein
MVAGEDRKPCDEAEIAFGNQSTCALLAAAQVGYRSQVSAAMNASIVVAVPETGCVPLENAEQMAGNIAVIQRAPRCTFAVQASMAQAAGAVAAIVTDDRDEDLSNMAGDFSAGDFSAVTIPAMMVTQDAGDKLRENLGQACAIRIGTLRDVITCGNIRI